MTLLHQEYVHVAQQGRQSVQELCKEFLITTCHFKILWKHPRMELMIVLDELVIY